jgi:hypothetical protein
MNNAKDPTLVHLEEWFNSAQDRAQQWFTTHTRIITVIAAFIAAFLLQLDTFEVFHRISSDAELRAKLVAHADSLRKEGEIVLKSDLGDQTTHQAILTDLKNRKSEFGTALDATPHFTTLSELQKWLTERLAGNKNADEIAATYIQLFLQKRYGSAADSFKEVNSEFQKSGFDLLPNPYPSLLSGKWSWPRRHLLGILVSAALLSLGAPFWFNTLKSLTNLRPKLAEEIDKDPKQIPQNSGTK